MSGDERWTRIEPILDRALSLAGEERADYVRRVCAGEPTLCADVEAFLAADAEAGGVLAAPTGAFIARFVEELRDRTVAGPTPDRGLAGSRDRALRALLEQATTRTDGALGATAPGACPSCARPLPDGGACPRCAATTVDGRPGRAPGPAAGPRRVAAYTILRELGAGGMGTVYEAHDERMNRRVALKVMSRHQAPSDKGRERFAREAWIAGKLSHPNLVRVFERGEWEELSYYSMELVDGGSLHDVIRSMRRQGSDGRQQLEFGSRAYVQWAIEQVASAARALHHAHLQGVVHRDVKPMNLLLARHPPAVKVTDFGLAIDRDISRLTTGNKVLGTLTYMAPEQLVGRSDVDGRADVYALGVTLFELLTLSLPYAGRSAQEYMSAVLNSEPRRPGRLNRQVGHDLETVIGKALEKAPRDRYETALSFAEDLDNVLRLRPVRARRIGWVRRLGKWIRRKPTHAALVALLIVALPTIGVIARREITLQQREREARITSLVKEIRWLENRRRYPEMVERTERVLRLEPAQAFALSRRALGRVRLARGAADEGTRAELRAGALADASQLVADAPQSAWAHRLRAVVLREAGREDEARGEDEAAARFRTAAPTDDELELDARLAVDAGDDDRALELWGELISRSPDDAVAVAGRGAVYDLLERYDDAEREYRIAVGINPELALTWVDLGRIAMLRDAPDEARRRLERALALAPDSAPAFEVLSDLHARNALAAQERGETAEAVEQLRQAERAARRTIELDPERPAPWINLGQILTQRQRLDPSPGADLLAQAEEAARRALASWDSPPQGGEDLAVYCVAWKNLCDVLIEQRKLQDARTVCRRIAELEPAEPDHFYNLAGVEALSGRRDGALDLLRTDLRLGDTDWRYLAEDPWFDTLRDDPRFGELLDDMRAAEAAGNAESAGPE